ncbi:helix-turn-helix domain-containing protein [Corynebacterium nuruki]|uniref:helix-turn-helix domain-containing protein n=1 Tax=Corynebacterium nuruki TaxID=1032851 RepID=UPI0039BF41F5
MALLNGFTRPQLAEELGRSPQTLARWANEGAGPAYKIIMGRAFYPTDAVEKWLADQDLHVPGAVA